MSHARYYWFGFVKKTLYQYPAGLNYNTTKGAEAIVCIKRALEDVEQTFNGDLKVKLAELLYFRNWKLFEVAMELHISESTAKNWSNEIVYAVARRMGYL